MNKKTIELVCYGPLALFSDAKVGWEDVWLKYEMHRKHICLGPMFAGEANLDNDIMIDQTFRGRGDPDADESLKELYSIKEHISSRKYFCDNWSARLPNIYIGGSDLIGRKDIEEATTWYLTTKGILRTEPRYQWRKPADRFLVYPA